MNIVYLIEWSICNYQESEEVVISLPHTSQTKSGVLSLVRATKARPVLCRAKDAFPERAILIRLEGTAVIGFQPRDFAVTQRANLLR